MKIIYIILLFLFASCAPLTPQERVDHRRQYEEWQRQHVQDMLEQKLWEDRYLKKGEKDE